jgi:flagellin-like protein
MAVFESPPVQSSRRARSTRNRKSPARRFHRGRRGVSDVIATILLLALTVVLFSSIFAFVTSFPAPPAQNTAQFSATLLLTTNQSYVKGIQITHLAGPSISTTANVWFKSATHPQAPEFQNPVLASTGLSGAATWNLGQTFNYTFPALQQPILPDNITVYITTPDQLLFSTVLPGASVNVAPNFPNSYTLPAAPAVGAGFTVYTTALGNLNANSVYINLANIPGLSGPYPTAQKMSFVSATDQWSFVVPASLTTTNGSFFAFVNVTGSLGQTATAAVTVTLVSNSGSSTSSLLSVAVVLTPQPPTLPATSSYFAAVVSYYGSLSNVPVSVKFWANQTPLSTPSGKFPISSQAFTAGSGLTISGPSTITVYSSSPLTYSQWLFNSSVVVQASATLTGVGSRNGTITYGTLNDVTGVVFSVNTATGLDTKSFSHSCTTTACPYMNLTVWDNWSTSVTIAGEVWANSTSSTGTVVPSTAVSASSSTTFSVLGVHTRWKPAIAGTYNLAMRLVVTAGGVTVGYIYDVWGPITVS